MAGGRANQHRCFEAGQSDVAPAKWLAQSYCFTVDRQNCLRHPRSVRDAQGLHIVSTSGYALRYRFHLLYSVRCHIYAIILPGQSWCLAAATALVFPVAGKVGASKLPGPEMRKHRKQDGKEASVRWRFQSIAMIKDNAVLFQSHGMPSDEKTHPLETQSLIHI